MDSNYSKFETVCRILKENSFDKSKLIPILQAVQERIQIFAERKFSFYSIVVEHFSRRRLWKVATFFAHFTLKHKGNHIIKICDGISCHVKKANSLINALKDKLGLKEAEYSTKDMFLLLK